MNAPAAASADEFDFIIVGAGSAGCVLANRLSADPTNRVCLIEAGPEDKNLWIQVPLGITALFEHPTLNWRFSTVPQEHAGRRSIYAPRGKVLGGSSAINGMVYLRGSAGDYDDWAAAGNRGWAYRDVLPYFLRSENNETWRNSPLHGTGGLLHVAEMRDRNPSAESFVEAAHLLQIPDCPDFSVPAPIGVGYRQVTQRGGRRLSTATAFLRPAMERSNLTVLTDTLTEKVLFKDRQATGVRILRDGQTRDITARREVILSAGAMGSPHILLRSGVGEPEHLAEMSVQVVHALPGVGRNLQDHNLVSVAQKTRSAVPYGLSMAALPRMAFSVLEYVFARRGMLTTNGSEAAAFVKSSPDLARADLQLSFVSGRRAASIRNQTVGHGYGLTAIQLRPWSRGSVRLTSAGAQAPPAIDFGMFSDERDLETLLKGIKLARAILSQPPFDRYGVIETTPDALIQDDDGLRAFIRNASGTSFHPAGSCAMGGGPDAVVDDRLAVRGLVGLRVIDASIMPTIVGGGINAPTIMIAEKGAELVLNRTPPAPIDLPA